MDITFIEVMPIGEEGHGRSDRFVPLDQVRAKLGERFHAGAEPSPQRRPGPLLADGGDGPPCRLHRGDELQFLRGLQSCPRHRHGPARDLPRHEAGVDLRAPLRSDRNGQAIDAAIDAAIAAKPGRPRLCRRLDQPRDPAGMHVTGG